VKQLAREPPQVSCCRLRLVCPSAQSCSKVSSTCRQRRARSRVPDLPSGQNSVLEKLDEDLELSSGESV
jgi:hypothetical protein